MTLTAIDYNESHWTIRTESNYTAPAQVASDYVEPIGWRGGTNKALKTSVSGGSWVIRSLDSPTALRMQGKVALKYFDGVFEIAFYQASPGVIQTGARIQATNDSGGQIVIYNDAGSQINSIVIGSFGSAWWTIDWTTRVVTGPVYMLDCNVRDADGIILVSSIDNVIKAGTPASRGWGIQGYGGATLLVDGLRWKINEA